MLDIVRKDIKNVHLSVHPPTGRVRISAPAQMNLDSIRLFAISKLGWIKQQQSKLRGQERESVREYLDRESHYVWGKRVLLKVIERDAVPRVELKHSSLVLQVRPNCGTSAKAAILSSWYREELRSEVPSIIKSWEPRLRVSVRTFFVQQMKTKWGSCNREARTIRLNSELAKKPMECMKYVVLHEMIHLIEPSHGERFESLIEQFMPNWRLYRDMLNRLPVRHERWDY